MRFSYPDIKSEYCPEIDINYAKESLPFLFLPLAAVLLPTLTCIPEKNRKEATTTQTSHNLRKRNGGLDTILGGRVMSNQLFIGDFNNRNKIMRSSKKVDN